MCSDKVQLPNPHLDRVASNEPDYLMHLGIHRVDWHKFKDVKFVCVGGTVDRMRKLTQHLAEKLNIEKLDYSFENQRYSGFKVGPIFCVTHGIGTPSLSVMLHEVFKLLYRAECSDVTLIRIGTCGGVGVKHGTVVVSTGAISAGFEPFYVTSSLGEIIKLPTDADPMLYQDIINSKAVEDTYDVILGLTYCSHDFYQGQGRFDGSFCDYTEEERAEFLKKLHQMGVVNIEMESAGVLGMAKKVGIKAAVVCVVLVDRLEAELPSPDLDIGLLQEYPITLVSRYIVKKLSN